MVISVVVSTTSLTFFCISLVTSGIIVPVARTTVIIIEIPLLSSLI